MIDGFQIGHHTADGDGWLTGTTVVVAAGGAVGGVDVRGGGPGTRETDLLDPTALVDRVHAVALTGGSAYGLAVADGVMSGLEASGSGFRVGPGPFDVVPIVPAAVIFDLGRGGAFQHRPTADFGHRALDAASAEDPSRGCVGAGTGAVCGGVKGGFGYAEIRLSSGVKVAAAVVVNATGSVFDPLTGRLWGDRQGRLASPSAGERQALAAARARAQPPAATTIGVIMTDAVLSKAQASKVAQVGHDGMARAIRPAHSMMDGDTVFCLASGRHTTAAPAPGSEVGPAEVFALTELLAFNELLAAAADTFTDACLDAVVSARGRGEWPAYRDLAPSAFPD